MTVEAGHHVQFLVADTVTYFQRIVFTGHNIRLSCRYTNMAHWINYQFHK